MQRLPLLLKETTREEFGGFCDSPSYSDTEIFPNSTCNGAVGKDFNKVKTAEPLLLPKKSHRVPDGSDDSDCEPKQCSDSDIDARNNNNKYSDRFPVVSGKPDMPTSNSDPSLKSTAMLASTRVRKLSLPGANKRVFTVLNYGQTPVQKVKPVTEKQQEVIDVIPIEQIGGKEEPSAINQSANFNSNNSQKLEGHGIYRHPEHTHVNPKYSPNVLSAKHRFMKHLHQNADHDDHKRSHNHKKSRRNTDEFSLNLSDDEDSVAYANGRIEKEGTSGTKRNSSVSSVNNNHSFPRTNSIYNIASMLANPIRDVIKLGQSFGRRKRDRLILKNGALNLLSVNVKKKSLRFFQDMFTTLVDIKWRYMLLLLAGAFLGTWIGFALIWWALCAYTLKRGGPICVIGVDSFESALLFSVETQHTIGYGTRAVTTECSLGIFFVMLQSLIGVTMSCVTTGLVFAKFARPRRRAETLMFSKSAVIYESKGQRYLGFRLGDIRRSHMIQVTLQAVMFSHDMSATDEVPFEQHNLNVEAEAGNFYFLAWPLTITHMIDSKSPLWDLSEEALVGADFEIVVVFEGTNSSTGLSTQICTSYLPSEIQWGHKFAPLITSRKESGQYLIDYDLFNTTLASTMSGNSARQAAINKTDCNDNLHSIPEIKISFENEHKC